MLINGKLLINVCLVYSVDAGITSPAQLKALDSASLDDILKPILTPREIKLFKISFQDWKVSEVSFNGNRFIVFSLPNSQFQGKLGKF